MEAEGEAKGEESGDEIELFIFNRYGLALDAVVGDIVVDDVARVGDEKNEWLPYVGDVMPMLMLLADADAATASLPLLIPSLASGDVVPLKTGWVVVPIGAAVVDMVMPLVGAAPTTRSTMTKSE